MHKFFWTEYKALLIGVAAYCILYAANELYGVLLIKTGIIIIESAKDSHRWHPLLIVSNLITTMLLVVPGFLGGRFSKNCGVVNGMLIILVCHTAKFFIFTVNHASMTLNVFLFLILVQQLITPFAVGAVSGGAGQLYHDKRAGGA